MIFVVVVVVIVLSSLLLSSLLSFSSLLFVAFVVVGEVVGVSSFGDLSVCIELDLVSYDCLQIKLI